MDGFWALESECLHYTKWANNTTRTIVLFFLLIELYINMLVNDEMVVLRGFVDPDKSYFDGVYIHTPNPNPHLTAQTAFVSGKDAPNLLMVIRAYADTLGDVLDSGETELPRLSVNNNGEYMSDSELYDFAKVY